MNPFIFYSRKDVDLNLNHFTHQTRDFDSKQIIKISGLVNFLGSFEDSNSKIWDLNLWFELFFSEYLKLWFDFVYWFRPLAFGNFSEVYSFVLMLLFFSSFKIDSSKIGLDFKLVQQNYNWKINSAWLINTLIDFSALLLFQNSSGISCLLSFTPKLFSFSVFQKSIDSNSKLINRKKNKNWHHFWFDDT